MKSLYNISELFLVHFLLKKHYILENKGTKKGSVNLINDLHTGTLSFREPVGKSVLGVGTSRKGT